LDFSRLAGPMTGLWRRKLQAPDAPSAEPT
jgi:hypothetical protein